MLAQGCAPDAITYSALVTAFERGGQWRRALGAYAQMAAQGCHPDATIYNALLGACWSSGVAAAQMRASLVWSAANRSGHFRVYHQAKSDPAVFQHACAAFTAGAAVVTLLRWLVDVRQRALRDGQALLRERVVFLFQKGKACRVEQPSALIRDAVAATLAGAGAPFEVTLVDGGATTRIEAEAGALASWLRSPAFAPLAHVAHAAAAKRATLEALIAEDRALEAQCAEALALVRSYEQLRAAGAGGGAGSGSGGAGGGGLSDLTLRRSVLDAALDWAKRLGLKRDTAYDALQLVQRCSAASSSSGGEGGSNGGGGGGASALLVAPMWRLTLAACLMLAARQGEPPSALPGYDAVARVTGYQPEGVAAAEQHAYLLCGGDVGAVSPLRVAHLLLERLGGGGGQGGGQGGGGGGGANGSGGGGGGGGGASGAGASLPEVAYRAALSPALDALPPTLVAAAAVRVLRKRRGQWPAWPGALEALTGLQAGAADFDGVAAELEAAVAAADAERQGAASGGEQLPPPLPQQQQQQQQQQQSKQQQPQQQQQQRSACPSPSAGSSSVSSAVASAGAPPSPPQQQPRAANQSPPPPPLGGSGGSPSGGGLAAALQALTLHQQQQQQQQQPAAASARGSE